MALEDYLDSGRIVVRSLMKLALGSGTYGFWNGLGTLTYGGLDYWPNHLIQVGEPLFSMGTAAAEFTVEMPESAEFKITEDTVASLEAEDYKGYPCTIYDAYFDPDTRELLYVEAMLYGYIDTVDHVFDDGQWKLVANMVTGAIDNHRDGFRSASHEDQQLISAGDTFFEHAGKTKKEYFDIEFD